MSSLGHKSVVYHGELRLGELDVKQVSSGNEFRFQNDEIRIHHISLASERCPPLAILQTIASFAVRCKLESSAPSKPPELMQLHSVCFHELKTAVVLLGGEEIHLVAMPSKEKKFPCFWCFSVPLGLYDSCLRMLNTRCLSIVFDLDETLIVANTMKSFEDKIEALKCWISRELDPVRANGMAAELKRFMDDRMMLKQYIDNDYAFDNGVFLKAQLEEVRPTSDGLEKKVYRPVIRLPEKNTVLTRINPEIRDTSVLVKMRPAWEELRSYLTAKTRKRFEVYVCTMAERDYALEMWRLLDPEAHLISLKELRDRIVCVKSDAKKSLLNVFNGGICHPKMAMVIDDRVKVWEDKDQPRVHVVPAYLPYYAPQAETALPVPILCVARNVACNVRGCFFREFDESLMSSISLVYYEDDVENLPPSPDVSNYVIIEDPGFASNGNITAPPITEGMCGGEVERRLNQASAADSTIPATSNAEQKPETPKPQIPIIPNNASSTTAAALLPPHKPSLLGAPRRDGFTFSDGGKPLMMRPGVEIRNQNFNQPPLLARIPMQPPSSSMRPQGGWLVEDENRPFPGRPAGSYSNQFSNGIQGSAPVASFTHPSHFRSEESCVDDDLKRQNPSRQSTEGGISQNQLVSNGREQHQTDGGKSNGGQSHLFVSALQEIGRRCGSKVEFRTVMSTNNKELQFSVEVLFTGEKIGIGMAKTKKDAHQLAAENALRSLAEKYVAHVSPPISGETDRDHHPINENGFLWESSEAAENKGLEENIS